VSLPDGPHMAFPFRVGADGRTATVRSMDDHVRDEVVQLVLTSPGERAFVTEFGGGVKRLVFEGVNDATAAVAKARLSQALSRWLGHRLTVDELRVDAVDATLDVTIRYHLVGSDDARLLTFQHQQGG
jgi:uncharacterized protein